MGEKCGLLMLPRTVPVEGVLPYIAQVPLTAKRQVKPYGHEYVTLCTWNQKTIFMKPVRGFLT
jgi:hypothetical protein